MRANMNKVNEDKKRHILSLVVDNKPGVLARIAGLFSGRGFNIESLSVAETTDPLISRITLVTIGSMSLVEQIEKQLNKLINVVKVTALTDAPFVQGEMALIKVRAKPEHRAEILRMVDIFRSRVIDVSPKYYTVEITGDTGKIRAFLNLLKPIGIKEIARTGAIALAREKT
jgi:acetolactate synthase-1/3 small subunit